MRTKIQMLSFGLLLLISLGCTASLCAEDKIPEIRDLDVETIEKLGRELYKRDSLAATATDLLFEKYPGARKMKFGGWLTEVGDKVSRVYLLKRADDGVKQGYVAVYSEGADPQINEHLDEPIPDSVKLRLLARSTAIEAIPGFYDRPYNFEVLDDPDGRGFIVYSLAATKDANEVVVGGHFRVTVSEDGKKAESVDALSKSLLIVPKRPPGADEEVGAFTVTHVVSPSPVETHVFLSLLHKKTFLMVTGKEALWKVEDGTITEVEAEAEQDDAGQPATAPESKLEGNSENQGEAEVRPGSK